MYNLYSNNLELSLNNTNSVLDNNEQVLTVYIFLTKDNPTVEHLIKKILYDFIDFQELFIFNQTILHSMVMKINMVSLGTFRMIIENGASVNNVDGEYFTPLHYLDPKQISPTDCDHIIEVIELFVSCEVYLNCVNIEGRTVLDMFCCQIINFSNEHKRIITAIINLGGGNHNTENISTEILEFIDK